MTRKRSCVVREGAERKGPATEPRSPPTSWQGHGAAIVIAEVTTRSGVWEVHIQGEVPQELVPDGEVDPDGSGDFVQKGHKNSGELTALKGAWLVREGAVGNVPRGNALAAYFTSFVKNTPIGRFDFFLKKETPFSFLCSLHSVISLRIPWAFQTSSQILQTSS